MVRLSYIWTMKTTTKTTKANHLAPIGNHRDYASSNGEWFGTKSSGQIWFWRTSEADEMATPTYHARTLEACNSQIDSMTK